MIEYLLVTHGNFSEKDYRAWSLSLCLQAGSFEALTLNHGDDVEELTRQGKKEQKSLTYRRRSPLYWWTCSGGSPGNVTASCLKQEGLECVQPANLPMLISVLEEREDGTLRSMPK